MSRSTIWISFDLGIRGDYESLYSWLDAHRAKECGDSVAVLKYEYTDSLPDRLRTDLEEAIDVDKRTRIYLVFRERSTNKNKGIFLFGGRRAPVWAGHAASDEDVVDEEA